MSFEELPHPPDNDAYPYSGVGANGRPWMCSKTRTSSGYAYAPPSRARRLSMVVSTAIYVGGTPPSRRGCGALHRAARTADVSSAITRNRGITLPNPASVGLHEGCGFSLVGIYRHIGHKLGQWHDVAWYQATVQPPSIEPGAPKSIRELVGTTEWNEAVASGLQHYVGNSR